MRAYSGEESAKKSPEAQVPPTSEHVTEATPLLKSNATLSLTSKKQHTWRSISLVVLGGAEVVGRVNVFAHTLLEIIRGNANLKQLTPPIIFLVAWVYATLKPIARPRPTVPYGILAVHLFSLLSSLGVFYLLGLKLGGQHKLSPASLIMHAINGFVTFVGICIIMSMPIHSNANVDVVDEDGLLPAKEDYVTLFQWLTFNWMSKFVAIGAERTVEESDIWQLSNLLRARVVMSKFRHFKRKTLLRRVLAANALDLSIDFVFTVSQPVFNEIS